MVISKYCSKVFRIVKKIYPNQVSREVSVFNLVKNTELSDELKETIDKHHIHIKQLKVDIYVKGQVAIEVQGEQHEKPIRFAWTQLHPEQYLERRKLLDRVKSAALLEAKIPLVCVWYYEIDTMTIDDLKKKIIEAQGFVENNIHKATVKSINKLKWNIKQETTEARKDRLERCKGIRKQNYLNKKQYMRQIKESKNS